VPVAAAALFLTTSTAPAQTGASRFALAQVADAGGKALVDIDADDFIVQEAGTARDILDVRVADYPVAIVLDNGAAARDDFVALRASVARFVTRLGPRPVAIVTTAGPKMLASFEDERETVLAKLDEVSVDPMADAAPLRAIVMAAEAIRSVGPLFSTLVVATSSPVEVARPAANELLPSIIDSHAVIHVIANVTHTTSDDGQLLRSISDQTHGEYRAIYSFASYQPALDRLAVRLTTELLIEYLVPVGSKAADVKIGVRVPGARVRGLGVAPR
jgi:hypothetical protein